jgi:plastocyanin
MRFKGIALFAGALLFAACGGSETKTTDTTSTTPAVTPAPAPAATGSATFMAPTGTEHTVNMVGDAQGYRYEPASLTVKAGDAIKYVMLSGAPHNVAFDAATVPEDVKAQLNANMPNATDMSSPMMMNANEAWTMSTTGIKPGTYSIFCTPHLAMGMKMELTIQ